MDAKAINNSPIGLKLQNSEAAKNDPVGKFLESIGLKQGMVDKLIFSVDLDGLDPKNARAALTKAPMGVAASLVEPLTPEKLGKLMAMVKKSISVTETKAEGATVYVLKPKLDDPMMAMMLGGGSLEVHLALAADGKALYMALNGNGLSSMLKRAGGKAEAIPGNVAVVRKALPAGCQMWVGLRFTDAMLKDIPKDGGPMFPKISPKYAGFGLTCGDAMDCTIVLDIGNKDAAKQIAGLMQMGMMGAMSQPTGSGGQAPPPFMSTMSSATDGSVIKISWKMTEADIEHMQKQVEGMPSVPMPPTRKAPPSSRKAPSPAVAPVPRVSAKQAMDPSTPATMVGRQLVQVKAELGRPRGVLKADGTTTWSYGDFDVVSRDGKTVARVETADNFRYVPVNGR
jgi:hypothetical protein